MRRRFTEQRDGIGVVAEINVTSLVDVAFTLLIIFMITAPILQGGIEIDLPEAPSSPLSSSDALIVSIDEEGQIYLADAPVTYGEFDATIEAALEQSGSDNVFFKADAESPWRLCVRVMGRIGEAGGVLSVITVPETRRSP